MIDFRLVLLFRESGFFLISRCGPGSARLFLGVIDLIDSECLPAFLCWYASIPPPWHQSKSIGEQHSKSEGNIVDRLIGAVAVSNSPLCSVIGCRRTGVGPQSEEVPINASNQWGCNGSVWRTCIICFAFLHTATHIWLRQLHDVLAG